MKPYFWNGKFSGACAVQINIQRLNIAVEYSQFTSMQIHKYLYALKRKACANVKHLIQRIVLVR
jgi:hypothetical protein